MRQHTQSSNSPNHPINKLIRRIQKQCAGHEVTDVALAVLAVMDTALEQIDADEVWYSVLVKWVQASLSRSAFKDIKHDNSPHQFADPSAITDNALLSAWTLGRVKALVEDCVKRWEFNRQTRSGSSLRNHYKIDPACAAIATRKLGQKFDDADLEKLFTVFIDLTIDMLDSITDDDQRNEFAFAVLRTFLPAKPATVDDLDVIKVCLEALKDISVPDEIRNDAMTVLLPRALSFANLGARLSEAAARAARNARDRKKLD